MFIVTPRETTMTRRVMRPESAEETPAGFPCGPRGTLGGAVGADGNAGRSAFNLVRCVATRKSDSAESCNPSLSECKSLR